jgi:hypothetical protein
MMGEIGAVLNVEKIFLKDCVKSQTTPHNTICVILCNAKYHAIITVRLGCRLVTDSSGKGKNSNMTYIALRRKS